MKRSGLLVIVVVTLAYLIAVTQRATMGTAALFATDKFHTNAEELSSLAVLQLVVYAGMQIPVGLLLDRFGARACLTIGALGMALGQLTVAFASDLSVAIVGRMLVGLGDAFTFISMIRVINGWYEGKKASQLQQWLGGLGQLGQVLSAFEFARLLHEQGWVFAFTTAAALGTLLALIIWVVIREDRNPRPEHASKLTLKNAVKQLRQSIEEPTTRMAFYTHFSTQSAGTTILLLWGVPYLSKAENLSRSIVSTLLSSMVIAGILAGLWYAKVCAHTPERRKFIVVLVAVVNIAAFSLLSLWPGQAPVWLLVALLLLVGAGGPSSMVAFDYSKQYVPKSRLGATNGFINIGGFLASFTMMFLIGVALDIRQSAVGGELYTLGGFRTAFVSIVLVSGFGLWRYLVNEKLVTKAIASNQD